MTRPLADAGRRDIRLVYTDMDGTTGLGAPIAPASVEAIAAFLDRGDRTVVLASGRPERNIRAAAQAVGLGSYLDRTLHASGSNGASATYRGRILVDQPIDTETLERITAGCDEHGYNFFAHGPRNSWVRNHDAWTAWAVEHTGYDVAGGLRDDCAYLMEIVREPEVPLGHFLAHVGLDSMHRYLTVLPIHAPFPGAPAPFDLVHVHAASASKGRALEAYLRTLPIDRGQCVVLGDSANDISALATPGVVSVVMGQARADIKAQVPHAYETLPVEQNGFAHALRTLVRD